MYQTPFQTLYMQAYLSSQKHKIVSVIKPTFFPMRTLRPSMIYNLPNIYKWLGASLEPQLTHLETEYWPLYRKGLTV